MNKQVSGYSVNDTDKTRETRQTTCSKVTKKGGNRNRSRKKTKKKENGEIKKYK